MSVAPAGTYFRALPEQKACQGRLTVRRWRLDVERPDIVHDLARALAAAHVPSAMRLNHPKGAVSTSLAPRGTTVRTGDFGEFLASLLCSQRMGEIVPYEKLSTKPVAGATQHGTDVLCLTLAPGREPQPTIMEVKTRSSISPKDDLQEITESLGRVNQDYLQSAWVTAVRLMEAHPAHRSAYALAAAVSLAKLNSPDEPGPDHDRQAVIVTASASLRLAKINEHWGSSPPVSELHLVEVPDLVQFMDRVYDWAGMLNYADVDLGVPAFLASADLEPGITGLVRAGAAEKAARAGLANPLMRVVEASLWALAGWDGMSTARAQQLAESNVDPATRGLAHLLAGRAACADNDLGEDRVLAPLVSAAARLWDQTLSEEEFDCQVTSLREALADPELSEAVGYVAAAIRYRYPRLPARMVDAAGAKGPRVRGVIDQAQKRGRQALWPSQAMAIEGGLLDRGHPSLAIKMPTSAGKTMLIELVTADALDAAPDGVVAVVAPTRALVRQLTSDLRRALGDAPVRSSHGGMDFDTEDLTGPGLLEDPGVIVVTPERLDLEWRRAFSGETAVSMSRLSLLVVDEAHLLSETHRGFRLEIVISRALRQGVRVVLLSSQFPDAGVLAKWLGGQPIESDWWECQPQLAPLCPSDLAPPG